MLSLPFGDQVDDVEQLEHLSTCRLLLSLNLEGNPLERIGQYRRVVVTHVPQLETLDDVDVEDDEREVVRGTAARWHTQPHTATRTHHWPLLVLTFPV